jgi:hypothetical protein
MAKVGPRDAMSAADDFAAWLLSTQGIAADALTPEQLAVFRHQFDEKVRRDAAWRTQTAPSRSLRVGDRRYAVAIQDGAELGLTFWIRRSATGEIFLLYPRDREMDPHASYHRDGTYHQKSYGVAMRVQKRQPLDSNFKGAEHLGKFSGHGTERLINDASTFDNVLVAPAGILSGNRGHIVVDLVEPGARPAPHHRAMMRIVAERTYRDASPWIVVAIDASPDELPKPRAEQDKAAK